MHEVMRWRNQETWGSAQEVSALALSRFRPENPERSPASSVEQLHHSDLSLFSNRSISAEVAILEASDAKECLDSLETQLRNARAGTDGHDSGNFFISRHGRIGGYCAITHGSGVIWKNRLLLEELVYVYNHLWSS